MAGPEPWADAKGRLQAAQQVGLLPPIQWPNEDFDRPKGSPFLAADMVGAAGEPVEMGPNAQWDEDGTLHVQVFVPWGYGSEPGRQLARQVVRLFQPPAAASGPVLYRRCSIGAGEKEQEGEGKWWVLPVWVDFTFQDHPASAG